MANGDDEPRFPGGTGVRDDVSSGTAFSGGVGGRPGGLDDVFHDDDREVPRDTLRAHIGWEIILLLGVVAVGALLVMGHRSAVSGDNLHDLLVFTAAIGLLGTAAAISLRAGAANLALGPVAAASGYFLVTHSDRGLTAAAGVTLLLALGGGAVIGLLVAALHVPGWAASLAGGLAVAGWLGTHSGSVKVDVSYDPKAQALYWFAAFAGTSILAGLLGTVRPIRTSLGRNRPTTDPALRRGGPAAFVAFAAVVVSTVLASVSGMALAMRATEVTTSDGFALTGLAIGAALLGGASVFGRRGGVFGTLLAVLLIALAIRYGELTNRHLSMLTIAAGAVAIGLVVSRVVETLGNSSDEADDADDPGPLYPTAPAPATSAWPDAEQPSWTSQLPARQIDDTWAGDQRWGAR